MKQRNPANRLAAAQALWISWEAEVLADGSTAAPLAVEQASQSEGHPWRYWRVTVEDQTAFDGARWSWDMACAWIASRQRSYALEGIAAFRKWRGRVWRDLVGRAIEGRTLRIAEAELRNALAGGDFEAKAIRSGEVVVIPRDEWPGLEWEKDENGEALEFDHLQMMGERRYRRVTVARLDIMRAWKPLDSWAPEVADGVVEEVPVSVAEPVDVEWSEVGEAVSVEVVSLPKPPAQMPPEPSAEEHSIPRPEERKIEKAPQKQKRGTKRSTVAALAARAEPPVIRRSYLERLWLDRGGKVSIGQGMQAIKAEFGDQMRASKATIQGDLAAIRRRHAQKS